jgi:hypothetical protein
MPSGKKSLARQLGKSVLINSLLMNLLISTAKGIAFTPIIRSKKKIK